MGRLSNGKSAGSIGLDSDRIDTVAYGRGALSYPTNSADLDVVADLAGLRQIKAPQVLADLVDLVSGEGYEISFYHAADVQGKVNGLYTVEQNAEPFSIWRIKNPDYPSQDRRIQITQEEGAPESFLFSHNAARTFWTLDRGDGLQLTERTITGGGGSNRVETTTVKGWNATTGYQEASKYIETYQPFLFGERKIQEVHAPGGGAQNERITTWEYEVDTLDADYGRLRLMTDPLGYWEYFEYDSDGRRSRVVSPWDSSSSVDATTYTLHRVQEYVYTAPDLDSDGLPDEVTMVLESALGQELSRTYGIAWGAQQTVSV